MIPRVNEAPPAAVEPFQAAENAVQSDFHCVGRCRDISFATSGIFLAYQGINYYANGESYNALLSGISFVLVGSSYLIVRKYGDIHVITKALQVALRKVEACSREVLTASARIRTSAEAIEPVANNVLTGFSNFQDNLTAMNDAAKRMEEGRVDVEEVIRLLNLFSNGEPIS